MLSEKNPIFGVGKIPVVEDSSLQFLLISHQYYYFRSRQPMRDHTRMDAGDQDLGRPTNMAHALVATG